MNDKIVGKCSLCGGLVTVPAVFWSVKPPTPQCQRCHAVMDVAAHLPTVPMVPPARAAGPRTRHFSEVIHARANGNGCCNRYADNMACDCLAEACGH